ncbi:MAG: hypothetical protein V4671_30955 [Armatimonadota bacterium]
MTYRYFPATAPLLLFVPLLLAAGSAPLRSAGQSVDSPIEIGPRQYSVNVMKNAKPKLPNFAPLAPKRGYVRGFVKDAGGKPLAGAKIGVRSTIAGGFYSGASSKTDARGYYEIQVPWGAAEFYCAGYTVNYGEGRAALGLHPADGEKDSFASANGHVENWVLLNYGIADADAASEKPGYANNYYGGSFYLDYSLADSRPIFADSYSLPVGSEIEVTLTPDGPLLDGSVGRPFTFRKRVLEEAANNFNVTNIPVGRYQIAARLIQGTKSSPLRLVETGPSSSQPFGLEPKDARGKALLSFRPNGAKAESATAQRGNWGSLSITLKR